MPIDEINSKYIFTDGEIISLKLNYQLPENDGFVTGATIKIKAKHALPNNKFEYSNLELQFTYVISLFISEDFKTENKISNMTLTQLNNGNFYVSLQPFNDSNEPDERDNFVIQAKNFSFHLLKN